MCMVEDKTAQVTVAAAEAPAAKWMGATMLRVAGAIAIATGVAHAALWTGAASERREVGDVASVMGVALAARWTAVEHVLVGG